MTNSNKKTSLKTIKKYIKKKGGGGGSKVTNLVRAAKREYFQKLINHNKDTSSLWRAMNEITHKSLNKAASCEIKCSPNSLNDFFLLLFFFFFSSESVLKSTDNSSCKDYEISPFLKCSAKTE